MFGLPDRAHRPSGLLCFSDAKPERAKVNAGIASVNAGNGEWAKHRTGDWAKGCPAHKANRLHGSDRIELFVHSARARSWRLSL
jgi:hypothetical protein